MVHGPKNRASSQVEKRQDEVPLMKFDESINNVLPDFNKSFVNPHYNEKLNTLKKKRKEKREKMKSGSNFLEDSP